jgi:hypothetical protein
MRSLFRWVDRLPQIKALIKWLSATLAAQRGLPLIIAIVFTVISLIINLIAALSGNVLLLICGFSVLYLALLIGFVGMLLAAPLGRG